MKKAKGKKLQIGLTNTGFHIAGLVKKHNVGDDNVHNDGHSPHGHQTEKSNDHPVTKYIENHLAGGILTTHHHHNYDKDTPFVQYDALEQQIVALKSSSRITLSLG
ncbi:hypothetical protein AX774_g7467 [Zancudomyces culisetae]|nr:hypothetical protein AX774_g7467 [Zancudomyces culisetae]|eukprot:OMH79132.1 hypothetical protein AX774_g7467 [Zancudomyces culisetae]